MLRSMGSQTFGDNLATEQEGGVSDRSKWMQVGARKGGQK